MTSAPTCRVNGAIKELKWTVGKQTQEEIMQDLALDWRWVEFVALWMSSLAVLLLLSTILMRHRRNHHDGGKW